MIYLDNSATTALDPDVREAMMPWLGGNPANASSIHGFGRAARVAVEASRTAIASCLGAHPAEIFFVSGGTEANNTVLKSMVSSGMVSSIAVGATEHHAVLHPAEWLAEKGCEVHILGVDQLGVVRPDDVERHNKASTLISVMHVNNETGVVNDVSAIRRTAPMAYLHTDAVQAVGKVSMNVTDLGVDFLSFSGHKLNGPVGIGGLFIKKGIDFQEHQHGGAQERNRRAGTEPVAMIVGFAAAVMKAHRLLVERSAYCSNLLAHARVLMAQYLPNIRFNTPLHGASPYILNMSFPELTSVDGEAIIQMLDMKGVAASNGSACVSGSQQPSHVLLAMGLNPMEAKAAVRFSVSHQTTSEEIERACTILADIIRKLRV